MSFHYMNILKSLREDLRILTALNRVLCEKRRFISHLQLKRMASSVASSNLPAETDIYKGMTVDSKDLSLSDLDFEIALKESLTTWISSGIRGVWFKVNLSHSSYIPILVKHGFSFHHAKASYAMMTRWLPSDEPNLLPQYPHTHVGVAGMVINNKKQVLAVQEKYHRPPHLYWKLPGGYSNPGEDLADTARREVFEETGIETEFVSVVTLRHHHQHLFHCGDIYVVCHLRPLTDVIKSSKDEIAQCQWMDIETYRNHPQVTTFNRFVMNSFLESERLCCAIKCTPVISFNNKAYHKVYHLQETGKEDDN